MDQFDLFCMIFLALDADWDDTHNVELGKFLSDANPFLFEGNVSAVRNVYENFCKFIGEASITRENSFEWADKYIDSLENDAVKESFCLLEKEQWDVALQDYLESKEKEGKNDF